VTKSSNHTLNLHRMTSNSSSTVNFPWLFPADSILVLRCIPILLTLLNSQFQFSNSPLVRVRVRVTQRDSELLYDWRFIAHHFVLATSPLRPTIRIFIFQLNTWGYCPWGWVCHLQLLLVLASAVIVRSESRGTHDHILLSQIRDSPNLEGQVQVFISPRNWVAQLYHQTLGSLSVAS
jgi:hypothetical protein